MAEPDVGNGGGQAVGGIRSALPHAGSQSRAAATEPPWKGTAQRLAVLWPFDRQLAVYLVPYRTKKAAENMCPLAKPPTLKK